MKVIQRSCLYVPVKVENFMFTRNIIHCLTRFDILVKSIDRLVKSVPYTNCIRWKQY